MPAPAVPQRPAPASPRRTRGALRVPVLWLGAALAATALVAAVDPNEPGHYPTCPLLAVTGLYCPGCGTLRAVHALAHGDVSTALARNPLAVLAVPVGVWLWLRWARVRWGVSGSARTPTPAWVQWGAAALVVAFGIVRNVPGLTLLSPA